MKASYKTVAVLSVSALLSTIFATGEAAKIDAYRDMLISKSYTIRYDNITPPKRQTNRDKSPLFGNSGMAVEKNDYLTNRQRSAIVTSDGENRYEEVGDGTFSQCRLIKGNEVFNFTKYPNKENPKEIEYMGSKKNKVEAVERNYLAESLEGESYGDTDITRILNAILPQDKKPAGSMVYAFAGAGNLPSGLSYEDYKGNVGNVTSVIRYYFNGANLTKIAAVEYYKDPAGNLQGQKFIANIKEFSAEPDAKLLKLPAGVEDATKRKNKE